MSNIELKSSSVNVNSHRLCFRNSDFDLRLQTVFRALAGDWRAPWPTEDVNNNNKAHQTVSISKPMSCSQVTQSHSVTEQFVHKSLESPPVVTDAPSPSIDVENDDDDDSGDNIMSPVSIPTSQQKVLHSDQRSILTAASQELAQSHAMELTAASVPAGFPLNYQQLYANNATLYGSPVMFSGAIHAAHASYMAGLPLHAAMSPNETYLKAIQAAACGMYSHSAMTSPMNPNLMTCKPQSIHNAAGSILPLAASAAVGPPKSPQCTSIEVQNKSEIEPKHDYIAPSPPNATVTVAATAAPRISSNGSGTYLNDKVSEASNDAGKDPRFKVPNGKEGSLKHRILRPPSTESSELNKTPTMRTYSTTSNFKKGTYIELANGALRRVEDMRTEDFIQCAERSPQHQLAESTVVKINSSQTLTAVITFSYDRNRSRVDMEVSLDHPFFVYGQGWASCNPDISLKVFGLKCQRLQVGDICISLTKRSSPDAASAVEPTSYQRRHSIASAPSPNATIKAPLNTTSDVAYPHVTSHAFSIPAQSNIQHPLSGYAEMAKLMSSYAYAKCLPQLPPEQLKDVILDASMLQSLPPKMVNAYYQNQIFQFAQQHQQQQQQHQHEHFRRAELKYNLQCTPPPLAVPSTYCMGAIKSQSPNPADIDHSQSHQTSQTHPLDASMSRKRRWSAPENMFDDDESEVQPPRNSQIPVSTNRLSSPVTART